VESDLLVNQDAIRDAKALGKTVAKTTAVASHEPSRLVPLLLTVASVGALLVIGAPLLRFRPVRRLATASATKLLWNLARR
jgi:hypothetical protein